ncbi:MAG: CYTH domain-containing protein [Pseudomonadota bacterium]
MALEIERKFLVRSDAWRADTGKASGLRQVYLATTEEASIRVRVIDDVLGRLTIKSSNAGLERAEFEYTIPVDEALALMRLGVGTPIEKVRHTVLVEGFTWDVDVFEGANTGLILAEVELAQSDQNIVIPDWIGAEVTGDPRYYNSRLTLLPYSSWS